VGVKSSHFGREIDRLTPYSITTIAIVLSSPEILKISGGEPAFPTAIFYILPFLIFFFRSSQVLSTKEENKK
jgi:hypothetical protein